MARQLKGLEESLPPRICEENAAAEERALPGSVYIRKGIMGGQSVQYCIRKPGFLVLPTQGNATGGGKNTEKHLFRVVGTEMSTTEASTSVLTTTE